VFISDDYGSIHEDAVNNRINKYVILADIDDVSFIFLRIQFIDLHETISWRK